MAVSSSNQLDSNTESVYVLFVLISILAYLLQCSANDTQAGQILNDFRFGASSKSTISLCPYSLGQPTHLCTGISIHPNALYGNLSGQFYD